MEQAILLRIVARNGMRSVRDYAGSSHASSARGGSRAGANVVGREQRSSAASRVRATLGSVTTAITLRRPPQAHSPSNLPKSSLELFQRLIAVEPPIGMVLLPCGTAGRARPAVRMTSIATHALVGLVRML